MKYKILASTDKSLAITPIPNPYGREEFVPQIRESVVRAYIKDYNKGNQWKYVNVEYYPAKECYMSKEWNQLKLGDDNTVIISPIKETFTRDEVLDVIRKYVTIYSEGNLEQWFNENY